MRGPQESVQRFENADGVRDDEPLLLGPRAFEHVERDGALLIFAIEIDDIVCPMAWDVVIQKGFVELG
jgi:hypothetical protein